MYRFGIALVFSLIFNLSAQADYRVHYTPTEKFQLIEFSGHILPHLANPRLKAVLDQITGKKDIVLKVGSSGGGVVSKFNWFAKAIKDRCTRERGSPCRLTAVFTAFCASACTHLPFLADEAIALPGASFWFHRVWVINPKLSFQSRRGFLRSYVKQGADETWFSNHSESLTDDQVNCHRVSQEEAVEAGFIDQRLPNWEAFVDQYAPN